jgi:hypothetical protein
VQILCNHSPNTCMSTATWNRLPGLSTPGLSLSTSTFDGCLRPRPASDLDYLSTWTRSTWVYARTRGDFAFDGLPSTWPRFRCGFALAFDLDPNGFAFDLDCDLHSPWTYAEPQYLQTWTRFPRMLSARLEPCLTFDGCLRPRLAFNLDLGSLSTVDFPSTWTSPSKD